MREIKHNYEFKMVNIYDKITNDRSLIGLLYGFIRYLKIQH